MSSFARCLRLASAAAVIGLTGAALQPLTSAPASAQPQRPAADVPDVVERVIDGVVFISTTASVQANRQGTMPQLPPGSPFEEFFEEFFKRRGEGNNNNNNEQNRQRRQTSLGSGFIIDPEGIVVTNNHVVEGAEEVFVTLNDGTRLKAEIVGRDAKVDLAVLKVKSSKPLKAVKFGDSDRLRLGEPVIAIGNPFGLGSTVTLGIISARNRDINSGPYDNFIQTDAAINRGNSGGPLFNMTGEVIGINTAIISPSGGSIGIGFAVPSATAGPVIDQLRNFGETRRGWIGVRITQVTDEVAESLGMPKASGALVAGLSDDGPAAKAGIKAGDIVVRFDGKDVKQMRDLPRMVADTPIGKVVDVTVLRKGKEEALKVTIERLVESDKQASAGKAAPAAPPPVAEKTDKVLGLTLSALNDDLRRKFKIKESVAGVVVTQVDRESVAAEKRLQAGEVIVELAQEAMSSPADVMRRVEQMKKDGQKSALLLVANPEGDVRFVALPLR